MTFMKKHFSDFSSTQRVCFLLGVLTIVVFAALLPFAFFDKPGLSFGWLVGNAISLLAYLSIVYGSKTLLSQGNTKPLALGLTTLFSILRFVLYGVGLLFGALCTFYWHNPWLNFWTVFAGYMGMPLFVVLNHFIEVNAEAKKAAAKPQEEPKEEVKQETKEEETSDE